MQFKSSLNFQNKTLPTHSLLGRGRRELKREYLTQLTDGTVSASELFAMVTEGVNGWGRW